MFLPWGNPFKCLNAIKKFRICSLWSFSQSRGTAAESEQIWDERARVSNRFDTLEVMRDAADAECDCCTHSVAKHTSKQACTWIDGPNKKSVTEKEIS